MTKEKLSFRQIIFLPTFLILLICLTGYAHAVLLDDGSSKGNAAILPSSKAGNATGIQNKQAVVNNSKKPEYVANEVIVKLKAKAAPNTLYQMAYSQRQSTDANTLSSLKSKYRLRDERPAFKYLHEQLKKANMSQAQLEEKTSMKLLAQTSSKGAQTIPAPKISKSSPDLLPIYVLKTDEDAQTVADTLSKDPDVEYAQPNYIRKVQMIPNDPYYQSSGSWGQSCDDLWGLKKIQCEQAWDISQGEGVVVAVIDTGVDYNHEDMRDNIYRDATGNVVGYDFVNNDNDPADDYGHGTHAAGTIAAMGNNNIGVVGVAPKAKIMPVKGLNAQGSGSDAGLAECIQYAVDNGAKVLSCSWGGEGDSQVLVDAFHYADSKGCIGIAAAGNSNWDVSYFCPANIDTVLAVGATTPDDTKCDFSNYGRKIGVVAPGGGYVTDARGYYNVLSTLPDNSQIATSHPEYKVSNGYYILAGTSMACPHVAGVAALLFSRNPDLSPKEVRDTIEAAADDIGLAGVDDTFGYGRLNAYRACTIGKAAVSIDFPLSKTYIKGDVNISGSAFVENDFQNYKLYYAPKNDPSNIREINSSSIPVQNSELGIWHTNNCLEGDYTLTLEVNYSGGLKCTFPINVTIDNINNPPVFVNLNSIQIVGEGTNSAFKIEVTDPDDPTTPEGQLTYSASNLPPNASFIISDGQPTFCWNNAPKGSYKTTFTVSDNQNIVRKDVIFSTMQFEILNYIDTEGSVYKVGMYGDKIIWGSRFNGMDEDPTNDYDEIYMYDLSSSTKIKLVDRPTVKMNPSIYENKIIWSELRYSAGTQPNYEDIHEYTYDPVNPQEIQIIGSDSYKSYSAIYGDKIVWSDNRNNQNGIFVYDGINEKQIASIRQGWPVGIYGNNIVWQDWNDPGKWGHELYLCRYDPVNPDIKKIADYDVIIDGFAIYEDKIVWLDERPMIDHDNVCGVYLYNILTGTENILTTASGALDPGMYQDKIVWAEVAFALRQSPPAIFIYDLAKSMKIPIANLDNNNKDPCLAIYEDKIAYVFHSNDAGDVIFVGRMHFRAAMTKPPALDPIGDKTINECQALDFTVSANGPAYLFAQNLPTGAQFADNADGTALFHWFPQYDQAGTYQVTFAATDGNITDSKTITITVNDVPSPQPPHDLVATANSHSGITIQWQYDDPSSIYGFIVSSRRSYDPPDYWSVMDGLMPSTSTTYVRTYSTLQPNTTYYFKVRAYRIGPIWSDYSNIASAITDRSPVLQAIGNKSVNENQSLTFTISATDPDNDSLTYSATGLPQGAVFEPTTRSFSWVPVHDQVGAYNITFIVSDGSLTASETIIITVNNVPLQPPTNLELAVASRNAARLQWQDNSNAEIGFKIERGVDVGKGAIEFKEIASVNANINYYVDSGLSRNIIYCYRVRAFNNMEFSDYSNITSAEIPNKPPIFDPIGNQTINESEKLKIIISATDPDGDELTYSAFDLPQGASFDPASRLFEWTPTYEQAGKYFVAFSVSDGDSTTQTPVTITVNNVNRPPAIDPVPDQTVKEGESLSLQLSAKDPDGDSLSYSFNRWDNSLRGLTLSPSGLLTWKLDYGQSGEYTLELIVCDVPSHPNDYIKTYFPLHIKVLDVDRPPVLNLIGNKIVNRLEVLSFTIKANDPDGDQVIYDIYNIPKGAQFDKTIGKFMWRPSIYQAGDFKVTFIAKDTIGALSQETITITVPNKAPVLDSISNKIVGVGQLLSFRITAKDPDKIDNSMLRYYAENLPKGAYLYLNGMFMWKPTKDQRGTYTVKFYVKDPPGLSNNKIVTITVR